jgi:methylmalonyl-CoA mutase cobalamin-binding subunit
MDKFDVNKLTDMLDKYGVEHVLLYVKGYCMVKSKKIREAGLNTIFSVGYEELARKITFLLKGEATEDKKEKNDENSSKIRKSKTVR